MTTLKKTNLYFLVSCMIGVGLSLYALAVEVETEKNKEYEAYCDINEYISCTKAFSSEYGKGFGIVGKILGEDSVINQPNSIGGIIFYTLLAVTSFSNNKAVLRFQIIGCIISNILSVYLAYILYFVLKDFCIVCVSTYVVNAANLVLLLSKWDIVEEISKSQTKKSAKSK